jgi:carbon-monoxide dehydrogenase medium subunit
VTDLLRSPIVQQQFPALAQAASSMAGVQIRNLATVGGNLCNASPRRSRDAAARPRRAAEGRRMPGVRTLPLTEFFQGPGKTILDADEMLVEIVVPLPQAGQRAMTSNSRRAAAMDISIVNLAVSVKRIDGSCADARIFMGAVGPTSARRAAGRCRVKPALLQRQLSRRRSLPPKRRGLLTTCAAHMVSPGNRRDLTRRALQRLSNGDSE